MAGYVTAKRIQSIVKEFDLQILILLGQKSNGKSTAVKNIAVKAAYEKGECLGYIRRYADDMKNDKIRKYFKSIKGFNIKSITKGEYDEIRSYRGELRFCKLEIDDKGKEHVKYGKLAGYCFAINDYEHHASLNYPEVKYLIFEEFITLKPYLDDEITKLNHITSTILRNNAGVLFMLANTISSMSPYFREYELTNINKQKVDTVEVYRKEDTNLGVFLTAPCDDKESYKMFFGAGASMIKRGEWQSHKQRKLENPRATYEVIYTMVLEYDTHLFLMEFLRHESGSHVWFVSKKTTPIQKNTRIISDKNIENEYCTIGFTPLSENESVIFKYLTLGKIAYSDNLTGTEFKQAVDLLKKTF